MEPKDKENSNLPKKEFKVAVLRKLSEFQENTKGQFSEIWKTIYKQNERFNKYIEITKKNKTEFLGTSLVIQWFKSTCQCRGLKFEPWLEN